MDLHTAQHSEQKEFKCLCTIFQNILQNQQTEKYRNLNFNRICKIFGTQSSTYLNWLYNAGFHRSTDGKRLIFDINKINELKGVYSSLLLVIGCTDNHQNQLAPKPQKSPSHNNRKEYETTTAIQYLKKSMMCDSIDEVNIDQLMECYFYLLHNYNDDHQFEHIYDELNGKCDLNTCIRLKRNRWNRSNTMHNFKLLYGQTCESYDMVKHSLMDKIHCYYRHTFDIGYSLNKSEKNRLAQFEETDAKNESTEYGTFVNRKILIMNKIISAKRKLFADNDSIGVFGQKYNQCKPQIDNKKRYSFGQQFKYTKHPWHDEKFVKFKQRIDVEPVFQSLKEEMLFNGLCDLQIEQFNNEQTKAKIYFNTTHCRRIKKPLYDTYKIWKLESKHLLALMVYCNYDMLQHCFSKTYRENFSDHCKFYYLGYYLKVVIHNFGTPNALGVGRDKTFYHGISNQYQFPAYTQCYIFGPLSTSISFPVALNFTNAKQGMVIEFADNNSSYASTLYFDVSWLSDFPNEKEHLFLQNAYGMRIVNIINATTGAEYWTILSSLQIFSDIMDGKAKKIYDNMNQQKKNVCNLMYLMVSHRLEKYFPQQYKRFESLTVYATNLIDTFFRNQIAIDVTYEEIYVLYPVIFGVLFHKDKEWIKLDILHALYPNLELLTIKGINLSGMVLTSLLIHCSKSDCKLNLIQITPTTIKNDLTMKQAISKFKDQFKSIGFVCLESCDELTIVREHSQCYQFYSIL